MRWYVILRKLCILRYLFCGEIENNYQPINIIGMKKHLLAGIVAVSFSLAGCEKETLLTEAQIPSEIKSFIATHFPSRTVLQSVKDKDKFELTYNIVLSEGTLLEFNRKKEIIAIEGNTPLPESVIPNTIFSYVNSNYAGNHVVEWELTDKKNQQVELNNGLELLFNQSGVFLRIEN